MDTADRIYLLTAIKNGGNIEPLIGKYSYSQLGAEIKSMLDKGLVSNENGLRMTEKGEAFFLNMCQNDKKRDILWIERMPDMKIEAISEDDIYLPERLMNDI
jgi:hypothetical protein